VDLLRGEQRKRIAQRTADLRAENGKRACAGAVGLELPVFEDVPEQIEVLNHRGKNLTTNGAKARKEIYIRVIEFSGVCGKLCAP
jgi:hypothetical protein